MGGWTKKEWFLKIIQRQREMIALETYLTVSTNGRDQDTIGLSVLYRRLKSVPVMGVNIRRDIFGMLERNGTLLGMWVSQSCHSLGRRGAGLAELVNKA